MHKNLSGTTGLVKIHGRDCRATRGGKGRPTACRCPWYGKYQGHVVHLARWSGKEVDPRELGPARLVFTRIKSAIDDKSFDPAGEHKTRTSGQTFAEYIDDWWIDYVEEQQLASAKGSLKDVVGVIKRGPLGQAALHDLTTDLIEEWLSTTRKARKWGKKNYNEYLALIVRLLDRAVARRKIKFNPARAIERMKGVNDHRGELRHFRLDEDIEAKLFEVAPLLNRTQRPNRNKLTQEKADAIRARATKGTLQSTIAQEFGVSTTVVCHVLQGKIWNPAHRATTTKGDEMTRRLIAVFDMGPRAGEMQRIQMQHVDWAHPRKLTDEKTGTKFNGYDINLPPELTKGGKWSGETQTLYAYTLRASRMLEARRFQLNKKPTAFIFGTEAGHSVKSFDKSWQALFTLAGLEWGRAKGLTWHTTRHEFGSRVNEQEKDPTIAQDLLRHKRLETTQRYIHTRRDRVRDAAARLNRG